MTPDMRTAVDVSVVITTRNRADLLAASLATLAESGTASLAWELLIVDNGSTDHTQKILAQAASTLPLRILSAPIPGKTRAQNLAVSQARGALIVFSDDDVVFQPDWLSELAAAARRWPDDGIFGGRIDIELPPRLPAWLRGDDLRPAIERHCAYFAPRTDEGPIDSAPLGPNMAIRRTLLANVRFDENVGPDGTDHYIKGGDTDIGHLLARRGHRFIYVPGAGISHHVRAAQLTLASILRALFRRGRKNAYLNPRPARHMIAGAPLSLWLGLGRQWLRFLVCQPLGANMRYRVGSKLFFRRGYLYQYRRQEKPVVAPRYANADKALTRR